MAEENVNVDGLDEAASQYDFLRSGTTQFEAPQFPKQQVPQIPQSPLKYNYPQLKSSDNPAYPMRDQVSGLPPFGLDGLPKDNTKDMSVSEALMARARRRALGAEDKNVYAKTYAFDSSPQGAHMARYKAYGQETFDKIGFNPELNNEAIFNDHTNMVDDFTRMFTHAAWPMLKLGFMAPLKSYRQMFTGDTSDDLKDAIDYEEYSAIGYSTKGGIGGFTNNVLNSAAYSAGVIGEAITEGMLIGAIEGSIVGPEGTVIGGAAGGVAGALKGIFQLPKSLWHLGKYGSQMLLNLKNAQKYTAAKEMFKAASRTVGDFVNPISNTKEAFANNVFGNADNLSRMARAARTFGGFYNDVKNINAALSEGTLEAGFVENNTYKTLYDKYYAQNGEAPTSDEQRSMRVQAQLASGWAKMYNTGLIFYTNKITFPNIMKGNMFRNAQQTIARSGSWKVVFDPKTQLYEKVKVGFKSAFKGILRPANYGKMSVAYFKTNVAEGIQENLQDVIADATEKYFVDSYKDKTKSTHDYAMAAMYNGFGKQFSGQGLETFMSGFAMGAVLRPLNNVPHWLGIGYNKFFKNRDNWTEHQQNRENDVQSLVDAMNLMHTKENGADFINLRAFNLGAMGSIGKVLNSEDVTTKEEIDAKHAALSTALITTLQTGTYDMFIDNFKGYAQMTPKELEDAWGLEEGQGEKALAKISEIVEKGKNLSARFNYATKKHQLKINLNDYKKGTPEYQKAKLIKDAYDISVKNLVFLQSAFDNNLERINKINNDFANLPGFADIPSTYIQALLDPSRLNSEMEMLRSEIEVGGEGVERKRQLLEAFENLQASEQIYTVDFYNKLREKYNKEGVNIDDDAILQELNEFALKFTELGINPEEDYQAAFADALRAIAGDNDTFNQFMMRPEASDSIGVLFNSLKDLTKLKSENRNLVPYINLLLDVDGFAEHVDRNYQWMQNLYDNRRDYYKDIVNEQVKNVEYNSLLADLADEGIYLDLDEFADFIENGTLPTYFIDSTTETIIREGSVLYDTYIDKFYMALENRDKNPAGDKSNLEERLEELIRERNEQRDKELEDARVVYLKELKVETGKTEEQLLKLQNIGDDKNEEKRRDLQNRINELNGYSEKLATATAPEITDIENKLVELNIFSKDPSELAQDLVNADIAAVQNSILELVKIHQDNNLEIAVDANNNIADPLITAGGITRLIAPTEIVNKVKELEQQLNAIPEVAPIQNALENTKAFKAYQKAITEINDKYDKLINELKAEYAKKAAGTEKVKPTVETPWEELPADLRNTLTPLFEEFKAKNNITPEEEASVRQNWLKSQALVIDEYNQGVAQVGIPKLLFLPNDFEGMGLQDLKLYQLRALRNTAQEYLNTNRKPDPEDEEETLPLTQDDRNNLEADVRSLDNYINSLRATFRADAALESKIEIFRQRVLARQDEIQEERDEEGNVVARYLDGKIAQRVTKHAEDIQSKITGKEPFMFSTIKEETLPDGTVKTPWALQYFRSLVDNDALTSEQRVAAFMSEFRKKQAKGQFAEEGKLRDLEASLKNSFTEENLIKTVNKLAFRESAVAGNTVDELIRTFFTLDPEGGFKKVTKPSNMTQDAFDSLFGTTGIITEFRDGMIDGKYFLLSNDLNVFDTNLLETGLAGAMDILAIDENGDFFIVDIKTSTEKTWDKFDTEYLYKVKPGETLATIAEKYNTTEEKLREINADNQSFEPGNTIFVAADANSKKLYFRLQQSIYRNLFYNMTGIMPQRLGLLPIALEYDLTGFITKAKKASIVPKGESTVDLEYAPEVEEYGVTLIAPTFEITPTIQTISTDIERRRQEVERIKKLPFQQRLSELKKLGIVTDVYRYGNRPVVVVNIAGVNIPFYRSSMGTSGKTKAKWFPFFGFGKVKATDTDLSWLIKADTKSNENNFNSKAIAEYSDIINSTLNWDHSLDLNLQNPFFNPEITFTGDEQDFNERIFGERDRAIVNDGGDSILKAYNIINEINAKYDAELTALEGTSQTTYQEEVPEDTSLGANIGKTVLFRGEVGKLVVTDDGVYAVEIPTEDGSRIVDLYSNSLPTKNKDVLASTVGLQFITQVVEPLQNQVIEDQEYKITFLDRPGNNVMVNDTEYRVNRNEFGQVVSLTFNTNQSKIRNIDARILDLSTQERQALTDQKKAKDDGHNEYANRLASKIANLRSDLQSLNIQRKKLVETNQQRTLRGGNMQDVIFALNSTPQVFSQGSSTKTVVDEVRELKQIKNLSASSTAAERIDMILSTNYPAELDTLLTEGISGINASDRAKIIEWTTNTIEELENYGFALLSKGDVTTDVENQILALNQLLNDLQLIKLKKDGQISKQQPKARKIFQPEKVQTGPSVPATQEPVSQQPEGVPPTTRREKPTKQEQAAVRATIKSIISNATDKDVADELLGLKKPTKGKKLTNDFIKKLNKVNSVDEMLILKADAHTQHIQDPTSMDIALFDAAFNKKLATFDTQLNLASVKENDYLIAKSDVEANTIYVVKGVNEEEGIVTLQVLGEKDIITLDDEDLKGYERFSEKPEKEAPVVMEEVTTETKDAVKETAQNLDDLEKTPGAFDDIEKNASETDKKTRFKNLKDNSKNC